MRAVGLNFADALTIKGHYQESPALRFLPGMEVVGRIDVRGQGAIDLALLARRSSGKIVLTIDDRT
jgi:NADPH:quinone reductase-like Zn-dependent oxidoreductase